MFSGDAPAPVGRGTFRGQRQIEIVRSPRPMSSMGANGKQGMVFIIKTFQNY